MLKDLLDLGVTFILIYFTYIILITSILNFWNGRNKLKWTLYSFQHRFWFKDSHSSTWPTTLTGVVSKSVINTTTIFFNFKLTNLIVMNVALFVRSWLQIDLLHVHHLISKRQKSHRKFNHLDDYFCLTMQRPD